MEYDFEIEKCVKEIKKDKAKLVLLQFPEGLKTKALDIAKEIEEKTKCRCLIWADTCFGACDIPLEVEKLKVDLIIHFGHYSRIQR
jgi:2-(3-amino-3-carboxypropyl)histidine synthase